jgi:hypothetical protein
MSSELTKDKARDAFSNALSVGKRYAVELAESEEFFKPIVMAMAIKDIRGALTPEAMGAVKELAGTSLGFLTDRTPDKQYPVEVIRECVIEAMIRGVGVVGNQFNIIAGRFYMARNGWEAKLRKAGCTQIVPTVGRPEDIRQGKPNDNGFAKFTATFGAQATCKKGGVTFTVSACLSEEIDGRIEASAFGKDMSDCLAGMKGKVEARILKKLYSLACDAMESDDEADLSSVIVVEAATPVIESEPKHIESPEMTDRERQEIVFSGWLQASQDRITDPVQLASVNEYWKAIKAAKNRNELRVLHQDLEKNQVKALSKRNVDELCRWAAWCAEALPNDRVKDSTKGGQP